MDSQLNCICIVRDKKIILAEYSEKGYYYSSLFPYIIPHITLKKKEIMTLRQSVILVDSSDGISYIAFISDSYPFRIGFDMLLKLKDTFNAKFTKEQQENTICFGLNKHFAKELKENYEFYNSPKCQNLLTEKQNVNVLREINQVDLDLILNNDEDFYYHFEHSPTPTTPRMKEVSTNMKKEQKKMWLYNKKVIFAIMIAIAVAIWLLTSFICGFSYSKC